MTVTNTGSRAAEELVQLYIHDRVASLTQPGRLLKDFTKVTLKPGETKRVTFTLDATELTFVGRQLTDVAEPGLFDVWIAPSAQGGPVTTFNLVR